MEKFELIPKELKKVKNWVCWCGDKLPRNPKTGGNAQSNNPDTWGTFEQALKACEKYKFDGVGFMFAPPYFGVDLDKCIDDVDFIDEFVEGLDSYTEYSRSGNGIHIICKGRLPDGRRRNGNVEMYQDGRYFICTGNVYGEEIRKIRDCTELIKPLHAKYLPETRPEMIPREFISVDFSDEEIIKKARNCKTGSLFQLLYSGQWDGLYPSQSEADMAFCNILAFWTQKNEAQMDRIYRESGLFREKWDRKQSGTTYGNLTLQKACAGCSQVYEPKIAKDDTSIALSFFKKDNNVKVQTSVNNYDQTDTGNAQRFRDKFKGKIKYSYNRKRWMYWSGKKWVFDEIGAIKSLADIITNDLKIEAFSFEDEKEQTVALNFAKKTQNTNRKEAMIKEAQHLDEVPILMHEMDSFGEYLNVQNGIVNLRNGELMRHEPEFLCTKISNAEYEPNAEKPEKWLKFLDDITGGDQELQRYLQKCVGYSLTASTSEQCAFFLYGMGNNGKSTFLDVVSNLLGEYSSNAQPDTLMLKKNDGVNSDIARLKSARFVSCEEPTEGVRLNEGLVKQLTGGGKVTCRFLYGDEFEYEPEFKIWVATNHKPVIRGTDVGIWRRIRLIPFEVNIPPEKVDKQLKFKLFAELPKIMKWAVEGAIAWRNEGLKKLPTVVKKATDDYKKEMDLLQSFVESCVVITNESVQTVSATDLYNAYRHWAKENNEYEMTSRKFFMEMTKKLPEKKRLGTGIVYCGVSLNESVKAISFNNFY